MSNFKLVKQPVELRYKGMKTLTESYLSDKYTDVPDVERYVSPSKAKEMEAKVALESLNAKSKTIDDNYKSAKLVRDTNSISFDNRIKAFAKSSKEDIFTAVLTEMYYNSLYLDDEFKLDNFNQISSVVETYIKDNGGYALLEKAYRLNKTPLLKQMIEVCEEVSKKVCARKYKEGADCATGYQPIKLDINEDESEDFNYRKDNLGTTEIAELVKEKVLRTVKAEKERELKQEELLADMESELSDNPEAKDESSITENLNRILFDNIPIEEGTLFNTLLRTSCQSLVEGTLSFDFTESKSPVTENSVVVEGFEYEDAILGDDIEEPESDNELLTEGMKVIFESTAMTIANAIEADDVDTLSESLNSLLENLTNESKSSMNRFELDRQRRDIRLIQKETELLVEASCKTKATEGCKSKVNEGCKRKSVKESDETEIETTDEACKKKLVENFADSLDECIESLDTILEEHAHIEEVVLEKMSMSKDGKSFIQPLLSKVDLKSPSNVLIYKIKAVEKTLTKMVSNVKDTKAVNKINSILEKNLSVASSLKAKFKKTKSKDNDKKVSALDKFESKVNALKSTLGSKIKAIKESYEFEDDFEIVGEGVTIDKVKKFMVDLSGIDVNKNSAAIIKISSEINKQVQSGGTIDSANLEDCQAMLKLFKALRTKQTQLVSALKDYKNPILKKTNIAIKATEKRIKALGGKVVKESFELDMCDPFIDSNCDDFDDEIEFDEDFDMEDDMVDCEESLSMDMVMAETIAKYTLMELCHTIQLENYSYASIKTMTTKMLNTKKK